MAIANGAGPYQFTDGNTDAEKLVGGTILQFTGSVQFHGLDTAITANTTTTSAPAGSLAITSNATGKGKLFVSDGTKWQYAAIS